MLACLAYAFTAASFYAMRPNDRYRHQFLLFAISIATSLSFFTRENIRTWLPPVITAALVLSVFTHQVFPSLRAEVADEVDEVDLRPDKNLCQKERSEIGLLDVEDGRATIAA